MKKFITGLVTLCLLCSLGGCGGTGLTHDILAYDNITAAAVEAKKGVDAFNTAVTAGTASRKGAMLRAVGAGVKALAQEQAMDPQQAEALAQSVLASLTGHLDNYAEQERRRAEIYEVTMDNLNYILQVCEQGKKFSIYRADISVQWKSYLESSARSAIGSIN